jgi:hypothetical protein
LPRFELPPINNLSPYHNLAILSKKFLLCNKTTQKLDQRCSGKKGQLAKVFGFAQGKNLDLARVLRQPRPLKT